MNVEQIPTWSDIGFVKYCQCGRQLIGAQEKESGMCGVCQWLGVET